MKFYEIRFNKHDYDQFDSFIVVANSEEDVIAHLKKDCQYQHSGGRSDDGSVDWSGGYEIKEIRPEDYSKTEIIIGSFNAG
jgi:hypothetical protein